MRSDYKPATAVCCICGHLIREAQINGCIEGTIWHHDQEMTVLVDPFVGYLCTECKTTVQNNIHGGIPKAQERARRLRDEDDAVGE